PARLTLARNRRGLTREALSRRMDRLVPARTITSYERGDREPPERTISAFADALRFPRDFFAADELEVAPVDGVSFRALTSMTASQRDAAVAAGTLAMALESWLAERFELPADDIPEIDRGGVSPEGAAAVVRARWNLGEAPVGNVIHLLEAHG